MMSRNDGKKQKGKQMQSAAMLRHCDEKHGEAGI